MGGRGQSLVSLKKKKKKRESRPKISLLRALCHNISGRPRPTPRRVQLEFTDEATPPRQRITRQTQRHQQRWKSRFFFSPPPPYFVFCFVSNITATPCGPVNTHTALELHPLPLPLLGATFINVQEMLLVQFV